MLSGAFGSAFHNFNRYKESEDIFSYVFPQLIANWSDLASYAFGNKNSRSENITKPRKVDFWGNDYQLKQHNLEMIITKALNNKENFLKIKRFWNRTFNTNHTIFYGKLRSDLSAQNFLVFCDFEYSKFLNSFSTSF